jgi:hypothetical protein
LVPIPPVPGRTRYRPRWRAGVIDAVDVFNQLGLRVVARVGGEQALLIGQQQQFIGAGEDRRQRGEIVVIADFDFGGRHGVIFVNDRHDIVIQQRAQGIAGVEETLAVFHIGAGQQHLANVNTINRKQLFPQLDKTALSHRRQQLFRRNGRGQFRVAEVLTPGGNRPGGHNDNTMTHRVQLCALAH